MRRHSAVVLALAASASAPAFAQSSVSIAGMVDTRVALGRGSVADRKSLTDGGYAASRLIFRGTEDLGGGLSASFWLESGFNSDDGTGLPTNTNNQASGATPAGSMTFGRRSTVSLAGPWGELRLGRDYVPNFWNFGTYDAFLGNGAGASLTWTNVNFIGPTTYRASNSVGYFVPRGLGGIFGQAMYFRGENGSSAGATRDDGNGWGFRGGFQNGPLEVAAAMTHTDLAAGDAVERNVGGMVDAGFARVLANVSRDKRGAISAKGWHISTVIPIGLGALRAGVSRYGTNAAGAPTADKLAVGYIYNFSKRTMAYTTAARLRNGGGASFALNSAVTAPNAKSTGFDLGIRHVF